MARALRESRSDETYIKKLQIVAFEALMMKKTRIGKCSSMIEEHFDMLYYEFGDGCGITSENKTIY